LTPVSFVVEGTVPSTWGSAVVADPTIPTVIYARDGRYAVVPAGEQVPATIDEVELSTEFPGPTFTNQTYERQDGTIVPLEFPTSEPEPSQPFRIERRDGCTDLTGPAIDTVFPDYFGTFAAETGGTYSAVEGGHRICGAPNVWFGSVFALFVSGLPTELPSIAVVESDGLWYVSPIGTLGASLVEVLRSVPDGANLIDTPIAYLLFGMGRTAIDSTLAGITNVPPACEHVVAFGADGVAAVVLDPPTGEIRACVGALFEFGVASSGTYAPAPLDVEVEETVPASTVPASDAPAGG
jgi:hypothetical protein